MFRCDLKWHAIRSSTQSIAAPHTSPKSLSGVLSSGGDFILRSVPGGPTILLHIVPTGHYLSRPSLGHLAFPIGTMCFPGQVEVALTNQAVVDVRVVIIAGPLSLLTCAQGSQLTVVPLWCVLLRHIPPPVAFWSLIFWRGLFRSVPGGPAIFLHIVPMVIDCLFCALGPLDYVLTVSLWAIISGKSLYIFYPIGTM